MRGAPGLCEGLLPGLPAERIRARYAAAPGDEIGSGKFESPESSAALAANAFGFFLDRPWELPPLPLRLPIDWPPLSLELEVENRFPWRGGRHPWLDAVVVTSTHLIGIESKRYEPYRSKGEPALSEAYWRPVWGEAMSGYCRVRDNIHAGRLQFRHLDAAQLVKHAFGLRTAVHRPDAPRRRRAVLVYLYAEPSSWPDVRPISGAARATHREEIGMFAGMVDGDEVAFRALAYRDLLDAWRETANPAIGAHAEAIRAHFCP